MTRRLPLIAAAAAILLFAGWSSLWGLKYAKIATMLERSTVALDALGWEVAGRLAARQGFPNRVDAAIEAIALAPPTGRWRLDAPRLLARTLSYRSDYVLLDAAQPLQFSWASGRVSATPRMSLFGGRDGFDRLSLDAEGVEIVAETGARSLVRGQIHLRSLDKSAGRYEFFIRLEGARPAFEAGVKDRRWRGAIDFDDRVAWSLSSPPTVESVTLVEGDLESFVAAARAVLGDAIAATIR